MKRIICVILASLIMLSFSVKANAEETTEENVMLTELLRNTNQEFISQFPEKECFDYTMEGVDLDEYSMLVRYMIPVALLGETDWDEVKAKANARDKKKDQLHILNERACTLKYYSSGSEFGLGDFYKKTPTYVQDILNGQQRQVILGEEVVIRNVLAFVLVKAVEEVEIVYETDQGIFVRFYENQYAQAVEFRWEDYIPLAIAYREYMQSYERNYSPDGEPLYGGNVPFLEYCQDPSKYLVIPASQQEEQPAEKKDYTAVIVIASALGVVALTAGAILVLRKKKR